MKHTTIIFKKDHSRSEARHKRSQSPDWPKKVMLCVWWD